MHTRPSLGDPSDNMRGDLTGLRQGAGFFGVKELVSRHVEPLLCIHGMVGQTDRDIGQEPDPQRLLVQHRTIALDRSSAFLAPIGHKNNTLIFGGGYRFSDYWRMGVLLEALVVVVSITAILVFWPL